MAVGVLGFICTNRTVYCWSVVRQGPGFPTNIYTDTAGTSYVSVPVSGSHPYASRLPASLGVLLDSGFPSVSPLNKPLLFPYLCIIHPPIRRPGAKQKSPEYIMETVLVRCIALSCCNPFSNICYF
jgi:hypothetical protein